MMNIYAKTFMVAARADRVEDTPKTRPAAAPRRRWFQRRTPKTAPRGF